VVKVVSVVLANNKIKPKTMNYLFMEHNEEFEWLSVSELAKRENVSIQTIYNRIKEGVYETMTFDRQGMNGYLIKTKKID